MGDLDAPGDRRRRGATFAARAIGYGIAGLRVDGNDFLAVYAATQWAAERARANHGATLIELFTYRAAAALDQRRSVAATARRTSCETWPLGDPIERLKAHLIAIGEWSEERQAALDKELADAVRAAAARGRELRHARPGPAAQRRDTMFDDVFKEMPWHLRSSASSAREMREAEPCRR